MQMVTFIAEIVLRYVSTEYIACQKFMPGSRLPSLNIIRISVFLSSPGPCRSEILVAEESAIVVRLEPVI
jgi:hypothetical protein